MISYVVYKNIEKDYKEKYEWENAIFTDVKVCEYRILIDISLFAVLYS